MVAHSFYEGICREIPQINDKTGLEYLDKLPEYQLKRSGFTLTVGTQTESRSFPDRRKGLKARLARLLYELTSKQRFYNAGWVWISHKVPIETRLTLPILHVLMQVSPHILSSRRMGWEPVNLYFHGGYDPVNDVLYWDRPEELRTSSPTPTAYRIDRPDRVSWLDETITKIKSSESDFKVEREPFTFPLTVDEVLSLEKNPDKTPEQQKEDYEKWFYSTDKTTPPDPKPHDPGDFTE